MRGSHVGDREAVRFQEYLCALLDLRLDLHFPLVVTVVLGRTDHREKIRRRLPLSQDVAIFAVRRQTVAALRGAHDGTTPFDNLRRGRHPLDALVEVLIERVAAVGRHDDIERRVERLHGGSLDVRRHPLVNGEDLAGAGTGDPAVAVDRHVDAEIDADVRCDPAYRVVNRIALGHAPPGVRAGDHLGIMETHRRLEPSEPRRH